MRTHRLRARLQSLQITACCRCHRPCLARLVSFDICRLPWQTNLRINLKYQFIQLRYGYVNCVICGCNCGGGGGHRFLHQNKYSYSLYLLLIWKAFCVMFTCLFIKTHLTIAVVLLCVWITATLDDLILAVQSNLSGPGHFTNSFPKLSVD